MFLLLPYWCHEKLVWVKDIHRKNIMLRWSAFAWQLAFFVVVFFNVFYVKLHWIQIYQCLHWLSVCWQCLWVELFSKINDIKIFSLSIDNFLSVLKLLKINKQTWRGYHFFFFKLISLQQCSVESLVSMQNQQVGYLLVFSPLLWFPFVSHLWLPRVDSDHPIWTIVLWKVVKGGIVW